ncbi:sirohydrochlorin chelatase [Dermacoccus abyssi]|uniref:sirohydrochlorin chelatase n=1 Tax=Dermacoccus abyssi TaxID=322596 RepID=UPI0021A2BCFD|nr:sirohydrochlorin chelatase [Dermacoccus abyssi]
MPDRALILVAHGTASERGRRVVIDLVEAVRRRRPELDVTDAYVDVQEPRVADVVAELAPRFDEVVVVPLLFCGGYHVRVDVAKAVDAWPNARSTGALGPSRLVAQLLARRLDDAGVRPGDAVVMAAAGSTRPEAAADARAQGRLLAEVRGGPVDVAYGSAGTPAVPDAVSANRDRPGARVAVASLLLGEGHFFDKLRRSGADVVTEPLGAAPEVVEQVLRRLDEP